MSYGVESCQCVAFRLDDIQDYWLNNVQMAVIDEFHKKDASITIGIIGNYFGNDVSLVNFIKTGIQNNSPEIEVANHGWNHEHFPLHIEPTQEFLLDKTNQKVLSLLGITPSGFIAPYDDINNDTIQALTAKKLGYLSANETIDHPPYPLSGSTLYHFPETAEIGAVNDDNTNWIDYTPDQTYAKILRSMTKYGYAVVMMHPQDFSQRHVFNYTNTINQTRIGQLDLVIDKVRDSGLKLVTIGEISKNAKFSGKYPAWLDRVFGWYMRGNITDSDIINTVNFLKSRHSISTTSQTLSKYTLHHDITATYFWVGESASKDNQYNDNLSSAWDSSWVVHFGGVDDPINRTGYLPVAFVPRENPFYFALPYDDFFVDGSRKPDAYSTVYWSHEKNWSDSESMVKNRWIAITQGNKTVYAQWEDAGPFLYDDKNYVFGTSPPVNAINKNAGLDVSPAVRDYLGLFNQGKNQVSWQFVDFEDIPDGLWKDVITTSQVSH